MTNEDHPTIQLWHPDRIGKFIETLERKYNFSEAVLLDVAIFASQCLITGKRMSNEETRLVYDSLIKSKEKIGNYKRSLKRETPVIDGIEYPRID